MNPATFDIGNEMNQGAQPHFIEPMRCEQSVGPANEKMTQLILKNYKPCRNLKVGFFKKKNKMTDLYLHYQKEETLQLISRNIKNYNSNNELYTNKSNSVE